MLSRRSFLGAAAACAAAGAVRAGDRFKLLEFSYSQLQLTGGPLADMYRGMHAHFLKLDEDGRSAREPRRDWVRLGALELVRGKPLEFDCRTAAGTVRRRPFYQVQRETYSTYFHRTEG